MSTKNKKISIIMLTYNRKNYAEKMIELVLGQTYHSFEYIIVNNGSTDGTDGVLKEYERQDSRVKVVNIGKSSISEGRRVGLQNANGKYITFVDDDDWITEDYIQTLLDAIEENHADVVYCGSENETKGQITEAYVPKSDEVLDGAEALVRMLKRKECNAALPSKLFRREIIKEQWFPKESMHEDIHVTYKIFANANRVVTLKKKLYRFNRNGQNTSAFTTNDLLLTPEQLQEYFQAFQERSKYIANVRPEIEDFGRYSEWSYLISMCNKIEINQLENCYKELKYIKRVLTEHYEEFYNSPYLLDFERAWMDKYINRGELEANGNI